MELSEFIETVTIPLCATQILDIVKCGGMCIGVGFGLYTMFSIFGYGIIQTLRLFNIKQY